MHRRRIWLIIIVAVIGGSALGVSFSRNVNPNSEVLSVRRVQITDRQGNPRIILTTNSEGTAQIVFLSSDRKKDSSIEQFRDGSMRLSFAGAGRHPSLTLNTDFLQGGPSLTMQGNGESQTILLGFRGDDSMSTPGGKPYVSDTWGLFFPANTSLDPAAGIGAARNPKSNEVRGFVFPVK